MSKEQDALKLALEMLEETRNALAWFYDSYPQDVTKKGDELLPHVETVLAAIREALAEQPAQQREPVGTVQCINGVTIGYLDVMQPVGTKLYTSLQPSKPWVGLTDEEMHECAGEYPWTPTGLKCCRAIEAKLREKNA